jgi:hypothetical protein
MGLQPFEIANGKLATRAAPQRINHNMTSPPFGDSV